MALVPIDRNSSGDVTMDFGGGVASKKCQILRFEPRATTEEINLPTLCEEPFGSGDPGQSRMIIPFAFKLFKGAGSLAPDLLANPFHVPCVWQWDEGCDVAGQFNFPDTTVPRIAGSPVTVASGVAMSDGEYVISWDTTAIS